MSTVTSEEKSTNVAKYTQRSDIPTATPTFKIVWVGSDDYVHQTNAAGLATNAPMIDHSLTPDRIHFAKPVCETQKHFQIKKYYWWNVFEELAMQFYNPSSQNSVVDLYHNYIKPAMVYNYYTYTQPSSPLIDHAISLHSQENKSNIKLSINDTICKDTNVLIKHLCYFE